MQITLAKVGLAAFMLVPFSLGCAHSEPTRRPQGSPILTCDRLNYDGENLSWRALIGAKAGAVKFDGRLIINSNLEIKKITECGSAAIVPFLREDYFPPPAKAEDIVTVEPAYWYGRDEHAHLFDQRLGGYGPDCIRLQLEFTILQPMGGATTIWVEAKR